MPSETRIRIGPPEPVTAPFYCPWCDRQIDDEHPYFDHADEHRDIAPYAHLVTEEFWPAGTAAHMLAEGIA